jgi:HK97 family phage portal protein
LGALKRTVLDFLGLKVDVPVSEAPVAGSQAAAKAASIYFKAAAVDTAISYIAGALSNCEFKVFVDGEEERGYLYYLLNVYPNPNSNAARMWYESTYRLLLDREALIVPVRDRLYSASSWSVDPKHLGHDRFKGVVVEDRQLKKEFRAGDCVHLQYGNSRARSLVDGMYRDYAQLLGSAMTGFKHHAGGKWLLDAKAMPQGSREFQQKDDAERMDPAGRLRRFMESAESVFIQNSNMEGLSQLDPGGVGYEEVAAIRKDMFETVAGIFKIPPPLMFGNMTNIKDLTRSFLTFSLDPVAALYSKELTAKFFTESEWLAGSRIQVDTSRVNHIDIFEIAAPISQLIGSGFSLDEVRDAINWPRIGTEESQEHLITRNFGALDEVLRQIAQQGGESKDEG